MPIKKSELYSSLWRSCDELRGGMDASQCKDDGLVLLFVKYLKGDKEIGDKMNKIISKLAETNDLKGAARPAPSWLARPARPAQRRGSAARAMAC
jgi:type I restriction enzyme M protein